MYRLCILSIYNVLLVIYGLMYIWNYVYKVYVLYNFVYEVYDLYSFILCNIKLFIKIMGYDIY